MRWTHVVGMTLGVAALALARPVQAQQAAKPPVIPHDTAGREQCLMCHGGSMEGIKAIPANHKGRTNDECLLCHGKTSPMHTGTPTAIPHDLAGRDQCLMCHGGSMEGVKAAPANHKGFDNKYCTLCHSAAKK
jgi:hypothetical protein